MIAIGLGKVEHLEKQLRVWVHGDDFVPLSYRVLHRIGTFFFK